MAEDFELNTLLSVFVDDAHAIPADFDGSSCSQQDLDAHVNRLSNE